MMTAGLTLVLALAQGGPARADADAPLWAQCMAICRVPQPGGDDLLTHTTGSGYDRRAAERQARDACRERGGTVDGVTCG